MRAKRVDMFSRTYNPNVMFPYTSKTQKGHRHVPAYVRFEICQLTSVGQTPATLRR
jgi:hypothetical protein